MADITMCSGNDCPIKERCYRFTATKSDWRQSFFFNPPIKEDKTCDYFWDNDTYKV